MSLGISVIICCHNSAKLLPETLARLENQNVKGNLLWEIILVDNASTDNTRDVALRVWPHDSPVNLKIVHEPKLGLKNARRRGVRESAKEVIAFIDDDNWVNEDWVQTASEVMSHNPGVGICGGSSLGVFEAPPPYWFECFQKSYAVGNQVTQEGDITASGGCLWGAGLIILKEAWDFLERCHFEPFLMGRQGSRLTAGEDLELCLALRLAGWRVRYEPRLRLQHFIPKSRLKWKYLRQMHRGFGAATIGHDPYYFALRCIQESHLLRLKRTWQWRALGTSKRLFSHGLKLFLAPFRPFEGDPDILDIEKQFGRLSALLSSRRKSEALFSIVSHAPWNRLATNNFRFP